MKNKKKSILKRLKDYGGKKSFLLYIAMVMSAVSGVMVLMPMVYIHRIVNNLILNGMVNFDLCKGKFNLCSSLCRSGAFLYT